MINPTESSTYRDLAPAEVIRQVYERFRVCRYLAVAAALRIGAGAILYLFWIGFDHANSHLRLASFVLQMIGYSAFSIAFAVQLAIYRCPICDAYLGRMKDKLHCPRCNAQVKA